MFRKHKFELEEVKMNGQSVLQYESKNPWLALLSKISVEKLDSFEWKILREGKQTI